LPRTQQAHGCAFRFRNIAAARGGYPVSLFQSGKKRQALSAPSPDKPGLEAGLSVLILKIPNNPILQSCARPDCNCGATLVRARMCVHVMKSRKTAARCTAGGAALPTLLPLATVSRISFSIEFA
jgi:hypothetical protein